MPARPPTDTTTAGVPGSGAGSPPGSSSGRLARSAGLVGSATLTSRLLGVVRDQVFAATFGAGDLMDAFNVAFRLPNLVRDLFAEGAMSAAFVPVFTRTLVQRGRGEAWRLGRLVISALLVVTGVIALGGMALADPLTRLFAGAYAAVPGKLELTVAMTRIMFPFLTLIALAVALMGMLNSLGWFFIPALSPAMFNVAVIVCALGLVPLMPSLELSPIIALAIGVLVGGVGQVALQWPAVRREGFRFRFQFAPRDPGLREVLRLMVPGTVGLAAVQINLLVNMILATGEGTSAISWLSYAFRIMYLPIGLFGVSIATAAVPALSSQGALADYATMRATVSRAIRMMLMLNVPATVGLAVLSVPIVAVIFERGRFTPADTDAVASALLYYAPGLVGYSAVKVGSPAFYALGDSRTPVKVSALSVALNVALALVLVRVMGYRGLALATAVTALFNAGMLLFLLRRRLGGVEEGRIALAFGKIAVASGLMAAAAVATDAILRDAGLTATTLLRAIRLTLTIGVAGVVLLGASRALRIAEFEGAMRELTARIRPRRPPA